MKKTICASLCLFSFAAMALSAGVTCHAPVSHHRLLDQWKQKAEGSKRKELEFLITGCARSGTSFMTKFFRLHGLSVKHEWNANYGIISWTMATGASKSPFGPASNEFYFKHVFHQVRHPLKTIASVLATEPKRTWLFICDEIPEISMSDPPIVRASKYWYYWNLRAESQAELTYRIESVGSVVSKMSQILGTPLDREKLTWISKESNHRFQTRKLSWLDLRKALNSKMYARIVCLAERYGYDVSEAKSYMHNQGK